VRTSLSTAGIVNWMGMADADKLAGLKNTGTVLKMVGAIDEFIGRIAPERLPALRRVATIESAASSTRIEGAKLTDREVERLLSYLDIKAFATRNEQEVAEYAESMETVFAHWEVMI
jgi:Fic family protein